MDSIKGINSIKVVEYCNSENRSIEKFYGRNSATLSGALLSALAHASKYQLRHRGELILRSDSVLLLASPATHVEVTKNGEPRDVSLRFLQFCFSVPPVVARARQRRSP